MKRISMLLGLLITTNIFIFAQLKLAYANPVSVDLGSPKKLAAMVHNYFKANYDPDWYLACVLGHGHLDRYNIYIGDDNSLTICTLRDDEYFDELSLGLKHVIDSLAVSGDTIYTSYEALPIEVSNKLSDLSNPERVQILLDNFKRSFDYEKETYRCFKTWKYGERSDTGDVKYFRISEFRFDPYMDPKFIKAYQDECRKTGLRPIIYHFPQNGPVIDSFANLPPIREENDLFIEYVSKYDDEMLKNSFKDVTMMPFEYVYVEESPNDSIIALFNAAKEFVPSILAICDCADKGTDLCTNSILRESIQRFMRFALFIGMLL